MLFLCSIFVCIEDVETTHVFWIYVWLYLVIYSYIYSTMENIHHLYSIICLKWPGVARGIN